MYEHEDRQARQRDVRMLVRESFHRDVDVGVDAGLAHALRPHEPSVQDVVLVAHRALVRREVVVPRLRRLQLLQYMCFY